MPARCPTCGEEALTETARFCIGCGGPLPEQDVDVVLAELADSVAPEPDDAPAMHLPQLRSEPEPPPAPPPPRDDTPAFAPRPVPSRAATPARPPTPSPPPGAKPPRQPTYPALRESAPIVPLPLVVAGVIGVLALLLILLLAA